MGMIQQLYLVPQPKIGVASGTSPTQITITASVSNPTLRYATAILFEVTVQITGTAPGTARDLSQVINYIELTDENGNVTHVDGQCLLVSTIDTIRRNPSILAQAWAPTVTGATGVAAVAQYAICGPFPGTVYNIVIGLNAATSTGYTSPSAAAYTVTSNLVEADYEQVFIPTGQTDQNGNPTFVPFTQPVYRYRIDARYVVNAQFTGKLLCKSAILGIDNAELGTKVSTVKCGGNTFSAQQATMAEDGLQGMIIVSSSLYGAVFANTATTPIKNIQTGNALGMGEFSGPTSTVLEISLNASSTMLILQRVQV